MIKVKVNNEYKDVVKIFCGGTLQKEIIKVWSREAQEYVYESSVEYTGSLPITINANGDALLDYRIYGADGGVGERTENLFDKSTVTDGLFLRSNGTIGTFIGFCVSDFIPVEEGDYLLYKGRSNYTGCANCIYDYNKNFLRGINSQPENINKISIESGEKYIRLSINVERKDVGIFKKGLSIPANYIPYGYKLPMVISDGNTEQTVPVYIGENQLDAGEYVSYGEQKIYKRTENLFELFPDMINADNWYFRKLYDFSYFIYYHLSPEQLTRLKNVGTVYGKAFEKEGGQYVRGTVLAITNKHIDTGVTTDMRLIQNNGNILNYSHDFTNDDDAYLCIGYGRGITEDTKQTYVDAILDNFDIMLSSTAPTSYIPYVAPTDPPVPLPEIPTIDGTTVIDYDGDPKPSQMYVKYRR